MNSREKPIRIAIVGGGLAGIAAATALSERPERVLTEDSTEESSLATFEIDLYEARTRLGGRASSFQDATTGELIDFCQHVSMGCCTAFEDLCQRLGVGPFFRRLRKLYFIGPSGRRVDFSASRWFPAPLHLLPSFLRLDYLTWAERFQSIRLLRRLTKSKLEAISDQTIEQWLQERQASPNAIRRFWEVVLVSALGESIDRVSVQSARKVFADAFLGPRGAQEVLLPELPLGELHGVRMAQAIEARGVNLLAGRAVKRIGFVDEFSEVNAEADLRGNVRKKGEEGCAERDALGVELAEGEFRCYDHVVLATTWRQAPRLLSDRLAERLPELAPLGDWSSSPITGVHLWFDRKVCDLEHAVLVDRMSQWVFYRGVCAAPTSECQDSHYYQVVISASHSLVGADSSLVIQQIVDELNSIWSLSKRARLLFSRVVTERHAVVSPTPEFERQRPSQRTSVGQLTLAGDWTATGWPSTMESAVRSGYLAAEVVRERSKKR